LGPRLNAELIGYFLPNTRSGSFVGAPSPRRIVLDLDVSGINEPDALVLDALARLEIVARRYGATLRLRRASDALTDLIECAGLAGVLEIERSGVEVDRQVEEGEQRGIDEEVHPGDGAV
jgi:hypothetical protein